MEWVHLDRDQIGEYGSVGVDMVEVARLTADGAFRVHVARVAAGGVLGRHPGRLWQVMHVVAGSGWVTDGADVRSAIDDGQAVLWNPGEVHGAGSQVGMTVVIVQSSVRLPHGAREGELPAS